MIKEKRMKKIVIIGIIVLVFAGIVYLGVSFLTKKGNQDAIADIRFKEIKKGDILEKISETGKLEAISSVKVKSNVTGSIKKLFVDEGNKVKAGQKLAIIQPGREVEQYLTSEILAPASGVIVEKSVEEGDMVTSGLSEYSGGTVIMSIADLSKMVVKVDINEVDISKVRVGLPAKIIVEAYKREEYEGRVTKISPTAKVSADGRINVFKTEVEVVSKAPELKPGMKTVVEIKIDERKGVLMCPIECVFEEEDEKGQNEQVVYTIVKGEIERKKVKIGLYDDDNIEIMKGLDEKEKVATSRPANYEKALQNKRDRMAGFGGRGGMRGL